MALVFDGVNDIVDHGDILAINGTAALTFMCHIVPTVAAARKGIMTKATNTTARNIEFIMQLATAGDLCAIFTNVIYGYTGAGTLVDGVLAHVALVFNGAGAANADRLKLYKDGTELTGLTFAGTVPSTITSSASTVRIARNSDVSSFFPATISNIKMWTAALSVEELIAEKDIYYPVRTRDVILWAPYDDGVAARDYSGQGYHGTVTEATQGQGPVINYTARVLAPDRAARRHDRSRRNQFSRLSSLLPYAVR